MIVCGEGELIKTFLQIGQLPEGQEIQGCFPVWVLFRVRQCPILKCGARNLFRESLIFAKTRGMNSALREAVAK